MVAQWSGTIQSSAYPLVSNVGGAWSLVDKSNPELATGAAHWGDPPNLVKAVLNAESSGDWERDNRVADVGRTDETGAPNYLLPFVGVFKSTAKAWGYDWNRLVGNKGLQIDAEAYGLRHLSDQYQGFANAATVYFGGPDALNAPFTDEFGRRSDQYTQDVINNWKYLDNVSADAPGIAPGTPDQTGRSGGAGTGTGGGSGGGFVPTLADLFSRAGVFLLGLALIGVGLWRIL